MHERPAKTHCLLPRNPAKRLLLQGPGLGDCRHFVQPNAEQAHALGASLAACPRLQKLELLVRNC